MIKFIGLVSSAILAVCAPISVQAQDDPASTSMSEQGDAKKGKRVFIQCQACHNVTSSGPNRAGPHLAGLIGRTAGGAENFKQYSTALKEADFAWTEERLFAFFENPNAYLPGVQATMRVRKIRKEQDRKDLIAYLRQATSGE